MARKPKYTAQQVIDALVNHKGIQAAAAKQLGCSRTTVSNYIENYPTVKAAYDEANETNIDYVEGRLMKAVNDGNITAIIFFLKTKAKHRGYIERQEIDHKTDEKIKVTISGDSN